MRLIMDRFNGWRGFAHFRLIDGDLFLVLIDLRFWFILIRFDGLKFWFYLASTNMLAQDVFSIEGDSTYFARIWSKIIIGKRYEYFCLKCLRSWSFMFPFVVNHLPHIWQQKGFSLVWILVWIIKFGRSEKAFGHPG